MVMVSWMDACSRFNANFNVVDPNWAENTAFGVINQTIGWLMSTNEKWTIVAGELDDNGYPRGITEIPTSIVLEIEILRSKTK